VRLVEKIGVGLIGCGQISPRHFDAIRQIPEFELMAVSDIDAGAAKKAGTEQGVPFYTNNNELLSRSDITLVSICTPISTHTNLAIDALNAGKDVLTEKPVGITLESIDRLSAVALKSGRKVFVVHQVRYNPSVYALKNAIDSGMLGKVLACNLVVRWFRPAKYFEDKWYGIKEIAGGTMLNQGIHYIDIMQWLIGEAKEVMGFTGHLRYPKVEVEDYAAGTIFFKNGCVGQMEINILTYDKNFECSFTVMGEKGTIKLGGKALQTIDYWCVQGHEKLTMPLGLAPNIYAKGLYEGSVPNHVDVYKDILREYQNNGKMEMTAQEARKSVEIALGIYASSEKGGLKMKLGAKR